jgi:hypothetical protein
MNHYVSLSLNNRKSSVHLHALYSPRTALGRFTPGRDQLVICGRYVTEVELSKAYVRCLLNHFPLSTQYRYRLTTLLAGAQGLFAYPVHESCSFLYLVCDGFCNAFNKLLCWNGPQEFNQFLRIVCWTPECFSESESSSASRWCSVEGPWVKCAATLSDSTTEQPCTWSRDNINTHLTSSNLLVKLNCYISMYSVHTIFNAFGTDFGASARIGPWPPLWGVSNLIRHMVGLLWTRD